MAGSIPQSHDDYFTPQNLDRLLDQKDEAKIQEFFKTLADLDQTAQKKALKRAAPTTADTILTTAIYKCKDPFLQGLIAMIASFDTQTQVHIFSHYTYTGTPILVLSRRDSVIKFLIPVLEMIARMNEEEQILIFNASSGYFLLNLLKSLALDKTKARILQFDVCCLLDVITTLHPNAQIPILSNGSLIQFNQAYPQLINHFFEMIDQLDLIKQSIVLSGRDRNYPEDKDRIGNKDDSHNSLLMIAIKKKEKPGEKHLMIEEEDQSLFFHLLEMIGRLDQDSQTTIFTDTDLVEHLNVLGMALKYHPNFVTHLLNFAKQKFDPTILSVILETCSSFDRNALMTAILHAPRCLDDLEDDGLLAALHTLNPIDCLATLSKPDQSGHSPLILAIINRNRCLLDLIHVIESLHPIDQQALIEGLVRTAAERPSFSCHNLLIVAAEFNPDSLEAFFSLIFKWPKKQQDLFFILPFWTEFFDRLRQQTSWHRHILMAQLSLLGFPGLEPTHNRSLAEVKEWFNQASPLSVLAYCQGRLERLEADKNESFDSEIQEILKVIHDMTQSRRLTLISVLDSAFLKLLSIPYLIKQGVWNQLSPEDHIPLSTLKAEEALQASKSRAVVAVNTLDKLRSIRAGHDDSIAKAKCSLAECKPMGNAESLEVDFGLLRAQVEKTALSISFRQGRALEASFSEKKSCLIIALLEYSRRNKCSTLILNLGKIRGSDSLVVNQANAILSYLHQYPHILHLKIFISEPHLAFLKEFMNTAEVLRTSGRHLNTLEADVPTFTIENFKSLTCSGTLKHLKMMSIQSKKPGTWGSLVPGTSWVYTATSPDAPRKESIASSTAFFATASAYNSEQRENLIA